MHIQYTYHDMSTQEFALATNHTSKIRQAPTASTNQKIIFVATNSRMESLPVAQPDVSPQNEGRDRMIEHLFSCLDIDPTALVEPPVTDPTLAIFPLPIWLQMQPKMHLISERNVTIIKFTVAYAVSKLLEHVKIPVSSYSQAELATLCSPNNFSVWVLQEDAADNGRDVIGVDMISPSVTVKIESNCSLAGSGSHRDEMPVLKRHVDTVITRHCSTCCSTKTDNEDGNRDDSLLCHSLGTLLYFMFSGDDSLPDESIKPSGSEEEEDNIDPPHCKKSTLSTCTSKMISLSRYATTSIMRLVRILLDCGDRDEKNRSNEAYSVLDEVIHDMHVMLLDPTRYLFEQETTCLNKASDKLHGRANEISALADSYSRVSTTGKSEAFIVGGYSGSGKSRLVQSVSASSIVSDGLLISKKFEAPPSNPLDVILSVFDDICALLESRCDENERHGIYNQIASEFGRGVYVLVRIVPNVIKLMPSRTDKISVISEAVNESDVNFFSLCNTVQRFMRIVSTAYPPITIVLDDLQWADAVSLGLIHTVLSDSASLVFFVGTYRNNEVLPTHIMFGFCDWLSKFNVPMTSIKIDGIALNDVNLMVSEALGMLPRLCQPLSQIVHQKTKGNPFFIQTFLRSIVDKGLLTYSLRERSWLWDIQHIDAEDITPNVLDLLSSKMVNLSQSVQTALKVASCFGIKMDALILQILTQDSKYSCLMDDLNETVEDGLMDLDKDTAGFKFVHDKVREAAYEMISPDYRDNFHYDIGTILLTNCETQPDMKNQCLFTILDQLNHGVPLLCDKTQSLSIARLNLQASEESMLRNNYTSAYNFAKFAISVLTDDSWKEQYDLCLDLYCLLAKAAYSFRKMDEAKDAVDKVVQWTNSTCDKLRGYVIHRSIILNTCNPHDASKLACTIIQLFQSLGENIPERLSDNDISEEVCTAMTSFTSLPDQDLLHMHKNNATKDQAAIMQAYELLAPLAFIGTPRACPYYVARWAQYCLQHRVASEHVPVAYVSFAVMLCQELNDNMRIGYHIGQLGLKLFHQSSCIRELPRIHHLYYGYVGIWFEPIQAVIDMHHKAFGIGYQVGDLSFAALHKMFYFNRKFYAGANLVQLKEELKHELTSEEYHSSFPILLTQLKHFHEAVMRLIGSDGVTSLPQEPESEIYDSERSFVAIEMAYLMYKGHFERVTHMGKRWSKVEGDKINFRSVYVHFYWALSSLVIAQSRKIVTKRKKKPNWPDINRLILIVKNAADFSSWNFRNKYMLLMAEKHSLYEHDSRSESAYSAAIEASRNSKFIHEEGLAWELAGMHYERVGNVQQALTSFQQALRCYEKWGSQMKVQAMEEKIKCISN